MKRLELLFFTTIFIISIQHTDAQDPYSRLKQAAGQNPVLRQSLSEVVIPESDPRRKVEKKTPIAFRSFEMADKKGTKIDPEETIAVNDKNEKAKVVFDKLNEIEKEQNAKGYSIRNKESALVIDIVTPASELDGRVPEMLKSIGPLRSESELKTLSATTKQVSSLTLNPFAQYNSAEREKLEGTKFEVNGSGVLSASAYGNANGLKTAKRFPVTGVTNPNRNSTLTTGNNTSPATALKVINETSTKDWSFGIMSTFKAGVEVSLVRYAKICPFNPESPCQNLK